MLVVRVEEGEVDAAEALLRFLYLARLPEDVAASPERLLRLYCLADRFQVGNLQLRQCVPPLQALPRGCEQLSRVVGVNSADTAPLLEGLAAWQLPPAALWPLQQSGLSHVRAG